MTGVVVLNGKGESGRVLDDYLARKGHVEILSDRYDKTPWDWMDEDMGNTFGVRPPVFCSIDSCNTWRNAGGDAVIAVIFTTGGAVSGVILSTAGNYVLRMNNSNNMPGTFH